MALVRSQITMIHQWVAVALRLATIALFSRLVIMIMLPAILPQQLHVIQEEGLGTRYYALATVFQLMAAINAIPVVKAGATLTKETGLRQPAPVITRPS